MIYFARCILTTRKTLITYFFEGKHVLEGEVLKPKNIVPVPLTAYVSQLHVAGCGIGIVQGGIKSSAGPLSGAF